MSAQLPDVRPNVERLASKKQWVTPTVADQRVTVITEAVKFSVGNEQGSTSGPAS